MDKIKALKAQLIELIKEGKRLTGSKPYTRKELRAFETYSLEELENLADSITFQVIDKFPGLGNE